MSSAKAGDGLTIALSKGRILDAMSSSLEALRNRLEGALQVRLVRCWRPAWGPKNVLEESLLPLGQEQDPVVTGR